MKNGIPVKTYYYENTNKPKANIIVVYLISFSYIGLIALAIYIGFCFFNNKPKTALILLAVVFAYLVFLRFYDVTHSWMEGQCIHFYKGKIIYRFDGLINMMGQTESSCTFKRIDDITVGKKKITIKGDITTREPMSRDKKHTKIDIPTGIENQDACIKEMREWL